MEIKIAVVGLGYVGLPLALALSKHFKVTGFDICEEKIECYKKGIDPSEEIEPQEMQNTTMVFSTDCKTIKENNFIIACVPTPVDEANQPDLRYLKSVSELIGDNLNKNSIVVYESTVYPGVTENFCVPILEKHSGLKCGIDFKVGYSPERINPGDKNHTINKITRIVSGIDRESANVIEMVYNQITTTHKAPSIKVAEAAKVIENIQRDINIALMNELKIIFDKKDINIYEVIEAAGTKWNFMKFYPGLVGGHCIGVDPYYLAYEAIKVGHHPEIILAGRRINDNMAKYETNRIIRKIIKENLTIKNLKIVVLGATFKPNVKDFRNSKVKDVIQELKSFGCDVKICEPNTSQKELFDTENITLEQAITEKYNVAIYAVKHNYFETKINEIKNNFDLFIHLLQ